MAGIPRWKGAVCGSSTGGVTGSRAGSLKRASVEGREARD